MPLGLRLLGRKTDRRKARFCASCRLEILPKRAAALSRDKQRFEFDQTTQIGVFEERIVQFQPPGLLCKPSRALLDNARRTADPLEDCRSW
jgi:hypothetical protein